MAPDESLRGRGEGGGGGGGGGGEGKRGEERSKWTLCTCINYSPQALFACGIYMLLFTLFVVTKLLFLPLFVCVHSCCGMLVYNFGVSVSANI